jgi:NTE family protein
MSRVLAVPHRPPSAPPTESAESAVRIGLVLSGGGLRGAGHLGVMQRLADSGISFDIIVGSSAGAVIAAFYAAVGLDLSELIADARRFRGRHLIAHSVNRRLHRRFEPRLARFCGIIPSRLSQLERATFDRLHHGVQAIGIVCHDVRTRQPCYFSTGEHGNAGMSEVARASASIPFLLPPIDVDCGDRRLRLTDGGVSDGLPIAFARRPPLSATHLIVSDCRMLPGRRPPAAEDAVYVRPRLSTVGTLWAPSSTLLAAVRQGAAAVTDDDLARIRSWRGRATGSVG